MPILASMERRDRALLELGRAIQAGGYRFTTVTPATHARILRRDPEGAGSLRDVFGWSRPISPAGLPDPLLSLLDEAGELLREGGRLRSGVRFSTLADGLFVHDAYPTDREEAVFFGPDTHRFVAFLLRRVERFEHLVDVGCGSGAGGIVLASRGGRVVLGEVNDRALRFASINAGLAGVRVELQRSDVLQGVAGAPDLVVANPPYLADPAERRYRHGGGGLGTDLPVRIATEALRRLRPGGRLLLYSGSPVVEGRNLLRDRLAPLLAAHLHSWEELDPDVFGEELEQPAYRRVERIAAMALEVRLQ